MPKKPFYPAPALLPAELAAELRRAERAHTRGMIVLVALLTLAACVLHGCVGARHAKRTRSYRAEHAAPSGRAWHGSDTGEN